MHVDANAHRSRTSSHLHTIWMSTSSGTLSRKSPTSFAVLFEVCLLGVSGPRRMRFSLSNDPLALSGFAFWDLSCILGLQVHQNALGRASKGVYQDLC